MFVDSFCWRCRNRLKIRQWEDYAWSSAKTGRRLWVMHAASGPQEKYWIEQKSRSTTLKIRNFTEVRWAIKLKIGHILSETEVQWGQRQKDTKLSIKMLMCAEMRAEMRADMCAEMKKATWKNRVNVKLITDIINSNTSKTNSWNQY